MQTAEDDALSTPSPQRNTPLKPPRSRWIGLEPLGVGTPFVESLSGYLMREAQAYAIPLGALIRYGIASQLALGYLDAARSNTVSGFLRAAYHMNGAGRMAETWIAAVGALTQRTDLVSLTLRAWSEIVHEPTLLISYKRWCPYCIADWLRERIPLREPLLWHIAAVTACPRHDCQLETLCPACHGPSPWLSWRCQPCHCATCQRLLVLHQPPVGSSERETSSAWNPSLPASIDSAQIAAQIADWLAETSKRTTPIPRARLTEALRRLLPSSREGGAAALARQLHVAKTTFWGWTSGRWPISLTALTALCQRQHCSIATFLAEAESEPGSDVGALVNRAPPRVGRAAAPIASTASPALPASTVSSPLAPSLDAAVALTQGEPVRLHHGKRTEQRIQRIRAAFAALLASTQGDTPSDRAPTASPATTPLPPSGSRHQSARSLSVRAVAAQLNVSPRTLRAYAPELYVVLLERGRRERGERKRQRVAAITALVRQAALDVAESGARPTCRRVGLSIGKPGIFREHSAREALATVRAELNQASAPQPAVSASAVSVSAGW